MNLPTLKFGNKKEKNNNYIHCYNCTRVMKGIAFNCITNEMFVKTWKRECDVLIDDGILFDNEKPISGKVRLLEIMHYYPTGLPTHVINYYVNNKFMVAHYWYCELAKNLFKEAYKSLKISSDGCGGQ